MSKELIFGEIAAGTSYLHRPAAYAVIENSERRIAAVKWRGGYFLPGGGSLTGEMPEQTIARELREELANSVNIVEKIGEAVQYFSADGAHYRMNATFYKASLSGKLESEPEHDLYWLNRKEIAGKFFHECHEWAVNQSE